MPAQHFIVRRALPAALFCLGLSFQMRADTIGYWQFGEGDVGTVASSVESTVNGAKLLGAASGQSGGVAPIYCAEVPGKIIREGKNGSIVDHNNTSSLSFVAGSKNAGGVVSIRTEVGSESVLQPKSFTLEAFVRTGQNQLFSRWFAENIVNAGSGWSLGPDWRQGMIAINVTDWRQQFHGYRNCNIPSNASKNSNISWHHIAVTYDDPSKTMTFFEDYQPQGKLVLPSDFIFQSDNGVLTIGDAKDGNAYTGLIDEVRLSDKALTPEQFLRAE